MELRFHYGKVESDYQYQDSLAWGSCAHMPLRDAATTVSGRRAVFQMRP